MSSYRARGLASVRAPGTGGSGAPGAWSLAELMVEGPSVPAVDATAIRESLLVEYQRGYAAGEMAGIAVGERRALAEAEIRFTECREITERVARDLESARAGILSAAEQNIAALAVVVARQIIEREIVMEPELIASLVRRALTEFPMDQPVSIRIHPLDLSALTARGSEGTPMPITGAREVTWIADARVNRGGLSIAGTDRIVDGRVDTALERAYRRMGVLDAT